MCGEQFKSGTSFSPVVGSPPRVRGTVFPLLSSTKSKRITPACAGNRSNDGIGQLKQKDHPRVCGEQQIFAPLSKLRNGSPPRVRGTAEHAIEHFVGDRITPACAGNRNIPKARAFPCGDHPRVCGEQSAPSNRSSGRSGSPPRVRGTAHPIAIMPVVIGITPACAGNSFASICP